MEESKKDTTYYVALYGGSAIIIGIVLLVISNNMKSVRKPAPVRTQIIYVNQPRVLHHQTYNKFYTGGYQGQ